MSTLRIITDTDGRKHEFVTDVHFLEYVRKLYTENESTNPYPSDIHFLPECIQHATEYIVEYCPELKLDEIEVDWRSVIHYKPHSGNSNVRCLTGDGNRRWTKELTLVTCPLCLDNERNKDYWNHYCSTLHKPF